MHRKFAGMKVLSVKNDQNKTLPYYICLVFKTTRYPCPWIVLPMLLDKVLPMSLAAQCQHSLRE